MKKIFALLAVTLVIASASIAQTGKTSKSDTSHKSMHKTMHKKMVKKDSTKM